MKDELRARGTSPDPCHSDLLDQAINDMKTEKFLTEDFIVNLFFGVLFASFESVSDILTLAFKLLAENPSALQELKVDKLLFLSFNLIYKMGRYI